MIKTDPTTPGPWAATAGFVRAKHGAICKMSHDSAIKYAAGQGSVEDAANAALIASAPELLEAVREAADYFHDFVESDHDEVRLAKIMRMAIQKATGPWNRSLQVPLECSECHKMTGGPADSVS